MQPNQLSTQPIIWIIGASTGIGLAVANAYADDGARVIISARNQSALEEMAISNPLFDALAMDVSQESSVEKASAFIESRYGYVNKVIINAGICEYIDSLKIDVESVKRVMDVNFFGAINVVNGALPLLRAVPEDNICGKQLAFVSSSVTYQALTRAGAYGSSKAALSYFAESLSLDVRHEGIDVRIISPGFVKTPLTDQNDFPMPARISAENAAKRILNGLDGSSFDINFPKRFTWTLKFLHMLPISWRHYLLAKTSRHKEDLQQISS